MKKTVSTPPAFTAFRKTGESLDTRCQDKPPGLIEPDTNRRGTRRGGNCLYIGSVHIIGRDDNRGGTWGSNSMYIIRSVHIIIGRDRGGVMIWRRGRIGRPQTIAEIFVHHAWQHGRDVVGEETG